MNVEHIESLEACPQQVQEDPRDIQILLEEIEQLEEDLQTSQESFTKHLFETTSGINLLALQLGKLRRCPLNNPKINGTELHVDSDSDSVEDECSKSTQVTQELDDKLAVLQTKLFYNINKSRHSIKRSLLKLNNLLSQHSLMLQPYSELKYYNKQLMKHHKNGEKSPWKKEPLGLTYSQVLRDLKELLTAEDDIESHIKVLVRQSTDMEIDPTYPSENASSNEFCGEYKSPPFVNR